MTTRARLRALVAIAACILAPAVAGPAHAHPLGNFSVNRFSGLEVLVDRIVVHHVIDMAEIPTFQELRAIDSDRDGVASAGELRAYAERTTRSLLTRISLEDGDSGVSLSVVNARATLLPGQGGLQTLRLESAYAAALTGPRTSLTYTDTSFATRLGWREIVAYARGGQGIVRSSVPSQSVTDELRDYPSDRLSSPLSVTSATVRVAPGATAAARGAPDGAEAGPVDSSSGVFTSLIGHELSIPFLALALLLAAGAGAVHALGPGHGKSVMAAYLVGAEGSARHAVAVGVAISLMHTASVIGLGLVTLWASRTFPPERVYPYLSLVSGALVLSLGAWLLWSRLRSRPHPRRGHDAHVHDGARAHAHGGSVHSHSPHEGVTSSPLSWKGLGLLALSGGLLPSPTALVVLLGAVALHRVALGLALVGAFSAGLAGALMLVGTLVLRARGFAEQRLGSRSAALLPVLSAATVCLVGLFLTTRAVVGL